MCIAGNQVLAKSRKLLTYMRTIANAVADKADDILNQPAHNKDGWSITTGRLYRGVHPFP
jgi:hypothetical protein